jgi:hypothetical protein
MCCTCNINTALDASPQAKPFSLSIQKNELQRYTYCNLLIPLRYACNMNGITCKPKNDTRLTPCPNGTQNTPKPCNTFSPPSIRTSPCCTAQCCVATKYNLSPIPLHELHSNCCVRYSTSPNEHRTVTHTTKQTTHSLLDTQSCI